MDVRADLHRLVDDCLDDDPRRALIAVYLGIVPSTPVTPLVGAQDPVRAWQRLRADARRRREFDADEVAAW